MKWFRNAGGLALVPAALIATGAQATSQPAVATDSAVYVERVSAGAGRRLEPARTLSRGDRIVTVVTWYRMGGQGGFVITNPLPQRLAYQESAQDNQEVSVDGGRSWGRLETMRVGNRMATPEDVTHVRWRIPATMAAQGRGQIAYSGIVR
ncbi:hypothetical protein [Novosphingobium colocasiae]|uniref:hypothetical protein n=1 Tax=Novosphingobium colocasiae TaxID=1256513 RepID=UPI0035B124AC